MKKEEPLQNTYARASQLFDAMQQLRQAWGTLHPPPPLKKGDMMLLGVLTEAEAHKEAPLTTGRLAQQLRQSPPGVSQRVGALEEKGYLKRKPDEKDRRVVWIQLTDKGRKVSRAALEQMLGPMENALAALGDEKTSQLATLMQELSEAIRQVVQAEQTSKEDMDFA